MDSSGTPLLWGGINEATLSLVLMRGAEPVRSTHTPPKAAEYIFTPDALQKASRAAKLPARWRAGTAFEKAYSASEG
jgi:hypothetical protein